MSASYKVSKFLVACGAVLLLTTPVLASSGNGSNPANDGTSMISAGNHLLLAGKGHGPGDGTGNGGSGPKDGTGNGPGDCTTGVSSYDLSVLLARGGNGNGGNGPGDGTGNDGDGPADGTGNGPGDCTTGVFSFDPGMLLARGGNGNGGNGNGGNGPGDGTGNGGNGPGDGTGNGPGTGTCVNS